jgi:hypothetical protein
MMRKLGDVMRVFAWCLVVAGVVIGSISVSYAIHETTTREAVWIQRELSSENAGRLRRLIRDIDGEVRPAGVIVSPWPGGLAGAGVSTLGVLILAIRRPARRVD